MLSNVDIRQCLGKHIGVYPFNGENLEGSSMYLTASKLAWSINTKKKLDVDSNGFITIEAHDSAIIITTESICLKNNFAGYCISRVSFGPRGLGSICYPVKPQWIGRLLITLHNYSDHKCKIKIGDKIAVLTIHRLLSSSMHSNPKQNSRFELLAEVGIQVSPEDVAEINKNCYIIDKELFHMMRSSDAYKHYIKVYNPFWNRKRTARIISALVLIIALLIIITAFLKTESSSVKTLLIASIGAILTCIFTMVKEIITDL